MGWYFTCKICGITEKYSRGCDCHIKAALKCLNEMRGKVIMDYKFADDQSIYFKLANEEKKFTYVVADFPFGQQEQVETDYFRSLTLTEDEFNKIKELEPEA